MIWIKKEVIEISDDESKNRTIELGRITNYNQLREIFLDRSPLRSDTETSSESDHPEPVETDSERSNPESLKGATKEIGRLDSAIPTAKESSEKEEVQPGFN